MTEQNDTKKNFSIPIFLIVILVLFSFSGYLSGETLTDKHHLNFNYLKQFWKDSGRVVSAPAHWEKKQLLTFGAVVGTGALFFAFDEQIKDWVRRNNKGMFADIWESVTNFGDGRNLGILLASYYVYGEIFRRDNMRKIALLGVESFIISSAVVALLKYSVGRARPYTGESNSSFRPFASSSQNYSFPSGHSSGVFSVATVIAEHSKELLVDWGAYGLAALVAMSRINKDKHWASDVFIGSAIGYFIGKKISDLHKADSPARLNIGFQFGPQKRVFSLFYCF